MGFKMTGLAETKVKFQKLKNNMPNAAEEAVERSTRKLYKDSQIEVPKKTHALAGSGRQVDHLIGGPKRSKGIRYGYPGEGDGIIDYAAAVHEILKASHAPPTKAKYVEGPLIQGVKMYHQYTRTAARKAVRKAFR